MIEQDKFGRILAIRGRDGKHILYPRQAKESGVIRRESSISAPVFGSVPKTADWAGVVLPNHGIQRLVTDKEFQGLDVDRYGNQNHCFHFPRHDKSDASEIIYPWAFSTKVSCREKTPAKDKQISTVHGFMIRRDNHCDNNKLMPVAYGQNLFFKVMRGELSLVVDGLRVLFQNAKLSHPCCVPLERSSRILLQTGQRTINISAAHFDELIVYSDNPDEYICLGLAMGLRRKNKILLNPGQSIHPWFTMDA